MKRPFQTVINDQDCTAQRSFLPRQCDFSLKPHQPEAFASISIFPDIFLRRYPREFFLPG